MSTAVKQLRVCLLSVKYNMMREMLNKVTFLTNVVFMMLNNAAFIIQWTILFRLKENIGGYTLREVLLLWALSASSYGLAHLLCARVFSLPDLIINGKLDSYLVQPKSVLLGVMTSSTNTSSIGDLLYGLVILCIFSFSLRNLLLFLLFTVTGAAILTAYALFWGSLSFWFVRADLFGSTMVDSMINFSTYPEGIFHGAAKFILYLVIPTGMSVYLPLNLMTDFGWSRLLLLLGYTVLICGAAVFTFYRGLRRYSSGCLMEART